MLRIVLSLFVATMATSAMAAQFGDCSGSINAQFLEDGRKMRLLADYVYTDGGAKPWRAPIQAVVDGASIPQFLWSFIGGPFEGLYRKASVVHDVECDAKKEPWSAVHRMFFDAMRCSGVSEPRAKVMYAAVYHCGPRWGDNQGIRLFPCNAEFVKQFVRRWKTLTYQNTDVALADLEQIDADRLVTLAADPIEELRRRLDGRASVRDTESGVVVTMQIGFGGAQGLAANDLALAREIGDALKNAPGITVLVAGFSDAVGSEQMNQRTSERRAEAVREQLAAAGVQEGQLSSVGFGESRPVASNDSPAGRQRNRRVEIILKEEL